MILAIHGVGYQHLSSTTEEPKWKAALASGLAAASVPLRFADELRFVHYGDLFLPKGTRAGADPPYDASDVESGFEAEMLELWFREAQRTDPNQPKPGDRTRLPHVLTTIQHMLDALSQSRTFAGLSERALIFNLKQVRQYLSSEITRQNIQARVAGAVRPGDQVVISHSLGTVVAYEALCAHPVWGIRGLITMGSPLGIRNLIFDRLIPGPAAGAGVWPPSLEWWVNVADPGDAVAIEKRLSNRFGNRVEDWEVSNGLAEVHGADRYLAQAAVGAALRRLDEASLAKADS